MVVSVAGKAIGGALGSYGLVALEVACFRPAPRPIAQLPEGASCIAAEAVPSLAALVAVEGTGFVEADAAV